jgi:DNA-binding CsgD family transcriptional regulator
VGLGRLAQARGQLTEANQRFEEALRTANQAHIPFLVWPSFLGLGEVSLMRGETALAHGLLGEALAVARSAADKLGHAAALSSLGRLARTKGEPEKASLLHCEALELRTEVGDRAGIVDSLEALAGLALDKADAERGVRLFAAAQVLRDAGLLRPAWLEDEYRAELARAPGGLDSKAFEAAWAAGSSMTLEEAVAHARQAEAPAEKRDRRWEALTEKEREVANLVAKGMTNREVAERLFVSPRTVQSHLSHIYTKLGITNRATLVSEVLRR